jgi:hypothetical protein
MEPFNNWKSGEGLKAYLESLVKAVKELQQHHINAVETPLKISNHTLLLNGIEDAGFWAKITGNATVDHAYKYSWIELTKDATDYENWSTLTGGRSGTTTTDYALNSAEDIDDTYTAVATNSIVWMREVIEDTTGTTEYWFSYNVSGATYTADDTYIEIDVLDSINHIGPGSMYTSTDILSVDSGGFCIDGSARYVEIVFDKITLERDEKGHVLTPTTTDKNTTLCIDIACLTGSRLLDGGDNHSDTVYYDSPTNKGELIQRNASAWQALEPGTEGQVLTSHTNSSLLTWETILPTSPSVGSILYANSSGDWVELGIGTDGQFLMSNGAGAAPSWETIS